MIHLATRCYTLAMPTSRPRHLITETDQVAAALDAAAEQWPAESGSRAKLLVHLVAEGHRALLAASEARITARRAAVLRSSGSATGCYQPGYLAELREDWAD